MTTPAIAFSDLHISYGPTEVVSSASAEISPGKLTGIIGPNGCGKSTLLKALARILPSRGWIEVRGKALASYSHRSLAQVLAMLPQSPVAPAGMLVADLVALGRHPHRKWWEQWGGGDGELVTAALEKTGCVDLADRPINALSGGQRQRVWLAMILAQNAEVVMLDEPTTYLDLSRAIDVLELVTDMTREGTSVVAVLHDLGLACRYCDELIVMKDGQVVAEGTPLQIISSDLLKDVYDLDCEIHDDPLTGDPMVVPLPASQKIPRSIR